MGKSFSQMMPLEFREVLHSPHILSIEIAFLVNHFLPVERQGCQLGHPLVREFNPSLSEAYSFISATFHSIFSGPFTLCKEIDSLHKVGSEESFNVVWLHIRRYAGEVDNPSIILSILVVFSIILILNIRLFLILLSHLLFNLVIKILFRLDFRVNFGLFLLVLLIILFLIPWKLLDWQFHSS